MPVTPNQNPGYSRQDYGTPEEFLISVEALLGIEEFALDIAAAADNAVCSRFYTVADDAFSKSWNAGDGCWSWLNPEFGALPRWIAHAYRESLLGANIAMLTPASIGATWWKQHVHRKAYVMGLNGRLTFIGCEDAYPKDCSLLLFGNLWRSLPHLDPTGYECWTWTEPDSRFE